MAEANRVPAEVWQRRAWIVGAAGLAVCALGGLAVESAPAFRAYLFAYQFWLGIPLGALALLMLQYLTGGAWGLVIRRILEAATRTLPVTALLFVPLLLGLSDLYPWARRELVEADPVLQHKQPYLNPVFFTVRAALYFAIWLTPALLLNHWSPLQDRPGGSGRDRRYRAVSAPGLVLAGLAVTFASIDWVMSLEPHWFSTIFGMLFGTGQVLSAFAFVVAALVVLSARPPLADVVSRAHLRDLGNLLLAFVMLWAYLNFSQYLLIWSGNLPEEIPWYVRRLAGGWEFVGLLLLVLHFALPFVLLLARDVKENGRRLLAVAGLVLAMRLVDLFWLIMPAAEGGGALDGLLDVAAVVGVGGLWLGTFLGQLGRRPLLPLADPEVELAKGVTHA